MDNFLSSVKKSCHLMQLFLDSPRELGVTEISKKLAMSKSAAHKLLTTLESEGFIRQNQKTKQYALGYTLLELGSKVLRDHNTVEYTKPHLVELAGQTKELVCLCIMDGKDAIYVDKIDSEYPIRFTVDAYRRFPLYATSSARCLLAYQSETFIDEVLASGLKAYTPQSLTSTEEMKQRLTTIRRNGYEVSSNLRNVGVTVIAAPIFDATGQAIASISLIGPSERMLLHMNDFQQKVLRTVSQLSLGLGYHH
ncbi:IclR family transcriptional regulator [Brevibacillus laterosporus]|uniref:IclR family transcriptional regulator n=1 Tax=Brevibacillus laterosporus TaxID=1465 RepID=UPI000EACDBE1|nr:IclR family transcriptional regulator [Brevibacillus laterosporus]AYK07613.1 IclR family transcriptional regulator [Brevibacillus laterosporus]